MTCTVIFAGTARSHLDGIEDHVAFERGEDVAEGLVDRIVDFCESLGSFPLRGRARDDIAPGLRAIGFERSGTVTYAVNKDDGIVVIVGVYFGPRDWEPIARGRRRSHSTPVEE